jgi:hypothetical protein
MAMTPTSLRIRTDLDRRLAEYCTASGATRSRVMNLALETWLGDAPPPPVFPRHEPDDDEPETAR